MDFQFEDLYAGDWEVMLTVGCASCSQIRIGRVSNSEYEVAKKNEDGSWISEGIFDFDRSRTCHLYRGTDAAVFLWRHQLHDRLVIRQDTKDGQVMIAAKRIRDSPKYDYRGFLGNQDVKVEAQVTVRNKQFVRIFTVQLSDRVPKPKVDHKVAFAPIAHSTYAVYCTDAKGQFEEEPYDCVIYRAGTGSLESFRNLRSIGLWRPPESGATRARLFAMYNKTHNQSENGFQAKHFPFERESNDEDGVGVWGAEEG